MVLDISDINNIKKVERLENVLQNNVIWPVNVDFVEYDVVDFS